MPSMQVNSATCLIDCSGRSSHVCYYSRLVALIKMHSPRLPVNTSITTLGISLHHSTVLHACSLSLLMRKVSAGTALDMLRQLCDKVIVVSKKDQLRDIASITLRLIIAELPAGPQADSAAMTITQKMLTGIKGRVSGRGTVWFRQWC